MKTCTKCNQTKPVAEFGFVSPSKLDGKLRADCRECVRIRARKGWSDDLDHFTNRMVSVKREARRKAKEFVAQYLQKQNCSDCGETDPIVMEFDHVGDDKQHDIARMVSVGKRVSKIEIEIRKCEVVCANCHRRRTAKRSGWIK